MIDTKALRKSYGYDRLPESYIIFITRKDILRKGQAIYEIDRYIKGSWEPYGDGTHIIHVCAANADEDTALGHLVHDLLCTDPEDIYYNELRTKVSYYKNDEEGIIEMTTEFNKMLRKSNQQGIKTGEKRGLKKGLKKGLDLGRRETELKIARSMIADNAMSLENIAKYSGLSLKEVESLKEESPAYK